MVLANRRRQDVPKDANMGARGTNRGSHIRQAPRVAEGNDHVSSSLQVCEAPIRGGLQCSEPSNISGRRDIRLVLVMSDNMRRDSQALRR